MRVMIDTNALIRYLGIELEKPQEDLSQKAREIISLGLQYGENVLFLSSISFLEIWSNLPKINEYSHLENFRSLTNQLYVMDNLRIVALDNEILFHYSKLEHPDILKEHDRIIYSTAITFDCDAILTADQSIRTFNKLTGEKFKVL
jgi:predicted nucleic acid-binding protein